MYLPPVFGKEGCLSNIEPNKISRYWEIFLLIVIVERKENFINDVFN